MNLPEKTRTVALYTADPLESACPILRINGPAQQLRGGRLYREASGKTVRSSLIPTRR